MLVRKTKSQIVIMTDDLYAYVARSRRVHTLNPEAVKAIIEMHNELNADDVLESKEDTIARLSAHLTEVSGQYRDLSCKLSVKESDIHDLIEKKKELENKLQDIIENGRGKEFNDLSISYKSLMTKYENIMTENEKLRASHNKDITDINSVNSKLKKENERLKVALDESQEEANGLISLKANVVGLLNEAKSEINKLEQKVKELQDEVVNRDSHIADLNKQIDNHQNTVVALESREKAITKLHQTVSALRASIDAKNECAVGAFDNPPIEITNGGKSIQLGGVIIYNGRRDRINNIAKLISEGRINVEVVILFEQTKTK